MWKLVSLNWRGKNVTVGVDTSTLPEERKHLERSLSERFNFFLIWIGLAVTGAINSGCTRTKLAVLLFGALVAALLCLVLIRTKMKLDWTLALLRASNMAHASNTESPELRSWPEGAGVIKIIGCVTPLVCLLGLIFGFLAVWNGWLR